MFESWYIGITTKSFSGEDLDSEDYIYGMDGQESAPGSPEMDQQVYPGSTPSESGPTPTNSKTGKAKKPKKSSVPVRYTGGLLQCYQYQQVHFYNLPHSHATFIYGTPFPANCTCFFHSISIYFCSWVTIPQGKKYRNLDVQSFFFTDTECHSLPMYT